MDTEPIRILLIEDDRGDVLLLKESLAEANSIRIKLTHADRLSDGLKQIADQTFDVILLDLNLPDSFGLETLSNLQRQAPNIPIVVLSGLADDDITIEAIRHGAQDFLVKGEISGPVLGRVLRYAIERKQMEQALTESERQYRQIIDTAQEGIWTIDANNRTTLANQRVADMFGYTIEEMIGKLVYEFTDDEGKAIGAKSLENRRLGINEQLDFKYIRKDGSIIWTIMETSSLYDSDGQYTGALAMLTDITERKRAEEKVRKQLQYLSALSEIDRMISSSFNLQLNLTTVLVHVIAQLGVDAADILLFHSASLRLEYAVGHGFHTRTIEKAPVSLSKGHAARASLNRRPVYIPDLKGQPDDSPRSALFESEGFVSYYAVPLLAKGELNGVLEVFRRSHVTPEKEWLDFLNTLAEQCAIAIENAALFNGLQRSNTELALAYDATIAGWSHALDLRDKETEGHSQRVTEMTLHLAQAMGISKQELVHIRRGALLHDIGKMGVPDAILLKPGSLTEDEWAIMKKHPGLAYEMLSPIAYLKPALDIPYCHHEKWDGTGYPRGLKGEQIPLAARIFAAVDVWDALLSDRPYRAAWSEEKVREHIRSLSGTHFDPQVAVVFLESNVVRLV